MPGTFPTAGQQFCSGTMAKGPLPLIGTCGYSYPEWIEAGIYPQGTKSAHMLTLYSRLFPVVELNYTWYQMVRSETSERMVQRIDGKFYFSAKLTRTMTHEIDGDWRKHARNYIQGIAPLRASGHLLAVLVQLPPTFHWTRKNRYYLANLFDALQGLPLAVEFRHHSWARDSVFLGLQARDITLVIVDTPPLPWLFPTLDVTTTTRLFYLRLHGRNLQGWRSGSMQQQFDYSYSSAELSAICRDIIQPQQARSAKGVIFFNNHVKGQAVHNGQALRQQLA